MRLAAAPTRESRHPGHSPGARAAWTFIGNVQAHFESSIRPRMRLDMAQDRSPARASRLLAGEPDIARVGVPCLGRRRRSRPIPLGSLRCAGDADGAAARYCLPFPRGGRSLRAGDRRERERSSAFRRGAPRDPDQRRASGEPGIRCHLFGRRRGRPDHPVRNAWRPTVEALMALCAPDRWSRDEPFAAPDALTRDQLYDDIQRIWQESRKTIVLVTHNVREAVCLGDRVVLMATGPGRIIRTFDIPLPRPRDINSPELAGYASQIAAVLKGVTGREAAEVRRGGRGSPV